MKKEKKKQAQTGGVKSNPSSPGSGTRWTRKVMNFFVSLSTMILSFVIAVMATLASGLVANEITLGPSFEVSQVSFLMVIKLLILFYVVWLGISAISQARRGKTASESMRKVVDEISKRLEGRSVLSRGYDYRDPKEFEVTTEGLMQELEAIPISNGFQEGTFDGLELVQDVVRSFSQAHSVRAAEQTLHVQTDSLEKQYKSRYFQDSAFAKSTLPLIGFAGTIVGIMASMNSLSIVFGKISNSSESVDGTAGVEQLAQAMGSVVGDLSIAFDTTLAALVMTYLVRRFEKEYSKLTHQNLLAAANDVKRNITARFEIPELSNRLREILQIIRKEEDLEDKKRIALDKVAEAEKAARDADDAQSELDGIEKTRTD